MAQTNPTSIFLLTKTIAFTMLVTGMAYAGIIDMKLVKPFLILNAIAWLSYGIACLLNPSLPMELVGITTTSSTAITEIRAMYGGVQSAIGVICLLGVITATMTRPALAIVAFVFTGLAISRVIGYLLDSSGSEYTYGAMAFETVGAIASMTIFLKQPPQAS